MAWKRVYVQGVGYRWTDGKGNYKTSKPNETRFRTPANDLVDAGTKTAKKGAVKTGNTVKKSVKATGEAASRTVENEKALKNQAMGYRARKEQEKRSTQSRSQSLTQRDKRIGNADVDKLRQAQNETMKAYDKKKPEQAKPAAKPPAASPKPTAAAKPTPKPIPKSSASKPAGKVPSSERRVSASTANRESGNYGTSRTNNPMIDADMKARMRKREEKQGVGPVKDGNRYAADMKNNTQGVGPVANAESYGSALKQPSASEKLKQTMRERQDEAKKRQRDNLLRAGGSRKPGSRY